MTSARMRVHLISEALAFCSIFCLKVNEVTVYTGSYREPLVTDCPQLCSIDKRLLQCQTQTQATAHYTREQGDVDEYK